MIKVLIVEDDPMVADLNKRFVDNIDGFKVVKVFNNGENAEIYLKNHKVDLIILDVYMPFMDGLTLLSRIRNASIMTDVILVTAAKESFSIDKALKLGIVDYLIKPFEFERLKTSLLNYSRRYNLLNHKSVISQEDFDKLKKFEIVKADKGLHKNTLMRVKACLNDLGAFATCDIISERIGMSKVTVRKYLEYLAETGEAEMEIDYGSIGRPSYLYRKLT